MLVKTNNVLASVEKSGYPVVTVLVTLVTAKCLKLLGVVT